MKKEIQCKPNKNTQNIDISPLEKIDFKAKGITGDEWYFLIINALSARKT